MWKAPEELREPVCFWVIELVCDDGPTLAPVYELAAGFFNKEGKWVWFLSKRLECRSLGWESICFEVTKSNTLLRGVMYLRLLCLTHYINEFAKEFVEEPIDPTELPLILMAASTKACYWIWSLMSVSAWNVGERVYLISIGGVVDLNLMACSSEHTLNQHWWSCAD